MIQDKFKNMEIGTILEKGTTRLCGYFLRYTLYAVPAVVNRYIDGFALRNKFGNRLVKIVLNRLRVWFSMCFRFILEAPGDALRESSEREKSGHPHSDFDWPRCDEASMECNRAYDWYDKCKRMITTC